MKKAIVYSDSLFADLHIPSSLIPIHVESFPGLKARETVAWLSDGDPRSLRSVLSEGDYDIALICFGTNDLGHGETAENVVENVLALQKVASDHGVKQVFITLLNENDREDVKEFNKLLDDRLGTDIELFDFFVDIDDGWLSDGLHLNETGKSELIAELIKQFE